MKSIHTFDVFAPTDEQEEAMNKKRGGHYRRGKNKEMDYFIECATSLFPNNHYSRFTPIYDTTKEFYQLITSSDTTERAILNWIASNRAWNYLFGNGLSIKNKNLVKNIKITENTKMRTKSTDLSKRKTGDVEK